LLALVVALSLGNTVHAFKATPRREALRCAATFASSAWVLPAFAKNKRTMELEKAEVAAKAEIEATTGLGAGAAGKGMRGTASEEFDKSDTVQKNRDVNGGLARDEKGRKVVIADRNPSPEQLGLKQWGGD